MCKFPVKEQNDSNFKSAQNKLYLIKLNKTFLFTIKMKIMWNFKMEAKDYTFELLYANLKCFLLHLVFCRMQLLNISFYGICGEIPCEKS